MAYVKPKPFPLQPLDPPSEQTFTRLRSEMVDQQIRPRGIKDARVLDAIATVPRHRFVPAASQVWAYCDEPIPIGYGQTISQPYIVAFMTEKADIPPAGKVLEVGTGSGYQAAILGELADEVYSLEVVPQLAKQARATLNQLGYRYIQVKQGNGYQGWPEHAPYDAILVTAAPTSVPSPLIDQLAPGGKLVIPVGGSSQTLLVMTRTPHGVITEYTIPVRFVSMIGETW